MRSASPARSTPGTRSCATTARWASTRLLQPAIKAAEEGYVVAPRIAFDWKNQFEKLKNGTNTERYLLPGGKPPVAGDVIHQPELGKTLRAIARPRARRLLLPARSPPTWWRPCAASAACTRWKISPRHSTETTVADRHHVQGLRRLAVPAERPGHHHAGDAQHPVAVRPDQVRAAQRRALPSSRRRPPASPT